MEKNLETEIIEALKSGKEEAFRYIYKTYYTDLCRIARGYLTDSYLSESIVEDLVYSLWENRSKITINTSLKNYLFRSVANKCINYLQLEYVRRKRPARQKTWSFTAIYGPWAKIRLSI